MPEDRLQDDSLDARIEALTARLDQSLRDRLDFFREQTPRPVGAPALWVHVIHGTWANPEDSRERPTWSEPGGRLEQNLRKFISPSDAARIRFAPVPPWSGNNSFTARAEAIGQLRRYLEDTLFDKNKTHAIHLLIAHSHGGTVAVGALTQLGPPCAREFAGLLTMGTPFLQRVTLYEQPGSTSFNGFTGFAVGPLSLGLGCAVALSWWTQGHGGVAAMLALLAVLPIVLARLPRTPLAAWISASLVLVLEPLSLFLLGLEGLADFLLYSIPALFLGLWLNSELPVWRATPLDRGDLQREDKMPPALGLPLLALRAPEDEASHAISAASALVGLNALLWPDLLAKARAGTKTIVACTVAAAAVVVIYLLVTGTRSDLALQVLAFPVLLVIAALLLSLVAKFAATCWLALACGLEVFEAPGAIKVYAEPLPRVRDSLNQNMVLRMVVPTQDDLASLTTPGTLRHSLYDYPSVQRFIAEWIVSHLPDDPVGKAE